MKKKLKAKTSKEPASKIDVNEYIQPTKTKGWKQYKAYTKGYIAAKKGASIIDCPYQLDESALRTLIKRDQWMKGWEEYRFRKRSPKQIAKEMKKRKVIAKAYGVKYQK